MFRHGIEDVQQPPHARGAHGDMAGSDCPATAEAATIVIQRHDDGKGHDRRDPTKRESFQCRMECCQTRLASELVNEDSLFQTS
jgi:hypothetical protein